jgi:hypothetical protein
MSFIKNEEYLESVREQFGEACLNGDWETTQTILEDLEDMNIDTYVLRHEMNLAMAEQADLEEIDAEPYQNLQRDNGY